MLASFTVVSAAQAQSAECASATPPPPPKPYILVLADTSGSMAEALAPAPDCNVANGYTSNYPATKGGHLRCGLFRSAETLGAWARVGLMAFPGVRLTDVAGANPSTCPADLGYSGQVSGCSYPHRACGTGDRTTRSAASILVPIAADNYWAQPASRVPSNVGALLGLVDNRCGDCQELPNSGNNTPVNGALRDAYRYLSGTFALTGTFEQSFSTPLVGGALERPCRQVHVVVITDGVETCEVPDDTNPNGTGAANAAKRLRDGFVGGGITWKVKTHAIQLGGSAVNSTIQSIAAAGGTTPVLALNSQDVADTITRIATAGLETEVCDNVDNDCNGCVDEGFEHFCNRGKVPRTIAQIEADPESRTVDVCCSGVRGAQNGTPNANTCFGRYYAASVGATERPVWYLPCQTPPGGPDASPTPETWLCESPRERCDSIDNDCNVGPDTIDEGITKCVDANGELACPAPESCDGRDNDCNGLVDDVAGDGVACVTAAGCAGVGQCTASGFGCVPSTGVEICDGIDNDCVGLIDETRDEDPGAPMIDVGGPCGSSVGECRLGLSACADRGTPGARVVCEGGVAPLDHDTCDGKDNDCDGVVDQDTYPEVGQSCAACGFEGTYQCRGAIVCASGPQTGAAEICNGLDDNCDGRIDENVPGAGEPCGTERSGCARGVYVCADASGVTALRCERPDGPCVEEPTTPDGGAPPDATPPANETDETDEPTTGDSAPSGGGCSTGTTSSSWLGLLVLAGLATRRRRDAAEVSR